MLQCFQKGIRGEISLAEITRYFLLTWYGFPDLWLRCPVTIWRVARILSGNKSFYMLSTFELWTRTYYEKLVQNFREVGRFGYVWDEGLGIPMGPRSYNNFATYMLYGILSPRCFSLLSIGSYLVGVLAIGLYVGHPLQSVFVVVILLGSPAILFSLVGYMIKPEVIWWSLSLLALAAALEHLWMIVWPVLGILLIVNTPVAAILGAMLAGLWLWSWGVTGVVPISYAMLWAGPGVFKQIWRCWYGYRDGFLHAVAGEQKRVRRQRRSILNDVIYLTGWFFLPIMLTSLSDWKQGIVLGGVGLAFYLGNYHIVKIADNVTVLVVLTSLVTVSVLVSGEILGLIGVALFVYAHPFNYAAGILKTGRGESIQQVKSQEWQTRLNAMSELLKSYPWFAPLPQPHPEALVALFNRIPNGARVLLESEGDGRGGGRFVSLRNWAASLLYSRQIELVNQTFLVRTVEPQLADIYLDYFTIKRLQPESMLQVCEKLGGSYVIAFTPETTSALEKVGFEHIMTVTYTDYAETASYLNMPKTDVTLLAYSETSIMSPPVVWERQGNRVTWEANAGQIYTLRYRFHPNFEAKQGSSYLEIEPFHVFDDLPLQFMKIQAMEDGPIQIKFISTWL